MRGLAKTRVRRGTRKRFVVLITDQMGNPQDPTSCTVMLIKEGTRQDDSPVGPATCANVGAVGSWGASFNLTATMTLGDWVARFTWYVAGVQDGEDFEFVVEDLVQPYSDQPSKVFPR